MSGVAHRVLVTGGSGFIGRHVVRSMLAAGHDVVVADLVEHPEVTTVVGDLCEPEVRERAVAGGFDAVVHLAAFTSVLESMEQPWFVHRTNVEMTAALIELCRTRGIGAFVLASTNAVVGDIGRATIVESLPTRPMSPYGATKAAAEVLVSGYAAAYGIRCPTLRLTNVYGGGMVDKDSFVPRLMRAAATGGEVEIYGDGEQRRDLVFVEDVARATVLAVEGWPSGPTIIGGDRSYTVNALAETAREATGLTITARHVPPKPGEMPAVLVDVARARSLGFEPEVGLLDGMRTTWLDFAPARAGV